MAAKQDFKENEEEAIGAHNELALYLDDSLKEEEFIKLKNLFKRCPLTSRQHENIKTMADLFQQLENDKKISVGDYKFFKEKLKKIHPSLATEMQEKEKRIQDILNGGPSPAKAQKTGDENQKQSPAEQKSMAMDIRELTVRQETLAVNQETMVASQETMAKEKHEIQDIHADLKPLIVSAIYRIKKEKEEKKFLQTNAFRDSQDKLRKNRVLVIKGNTGDGKTSTAIQLLHWLINEQPSRQPLQLHDIKDLKLITPNSNLVTFIDDAFGEKDVGKIDVQDWSKRLEHVKTLFVDTQIHANFLLITIRNEIFNSLTKSSLGAVFSEDNIIDLSSHRYINAVEKRKLLQMYTPEKFAWTAEEMKKVISYSPNIGFPQCCQLFCKSVKLQERRVKFFEKPFHFFMDVLLKLPECSAILFLFLNDGKIKKKDLDPNGNKVNKALLEEAFDISLFGGEDDRTTMTFKKKIRFVQDSLDKLLGFLVRKGKDWLGDEVYRFDHDSIYVTVALLYGKNTTFGYIQNCPVQSLCYLTISKTSSNMVAISSDHYLYMCERFLREFESEKWHFNATIMSLDVWKDHVFVKRFVLFLNEKKIDKLGLFNNSCHSASVDCALYLLSEGVKPDEGTQWWPLITRGVWADKGDVDILKKVVTYLNDETKLLLLNNACYSGSEECALYLLCEGIKPDKATPWWPLITRGVWAGKGDVDILKKVVIYLNDETKLLLLNNACYSGSEECALYLLCEGVKPDEATPLWALITRGVRAGKGDVDILKKVVTYLNDETKLLLLNNACRSGSEECALYLLREGVKPDEDTPWWSLITKGVWAGKGDVDILKKVVIYLNDETKLLLLNNACRSGSEECALYLLCEGVKPDEETSWWPLITRGVWEGKGDVDILKKVVTYLNDETKLLLLNNACRSGSEECALYLLREGVKPDKDTPWWPLITRGVWAGKGDVDILKKVVIYLNDETKLLLLNNACRSGSEECALYLLCEGVKPDEETPWWPLIKRGMLDHKGDVNILKKVFIHLDEEMKLTLLNKACDSGSEECALYLLCEGVKPDEATPLWALITRGVWAGKGDVDILKKFVTYLNDETKLLLLNNACRSGSEECALYLLREGVKPDEDTPWWSLITKGVWADKGDVDILKKVVIYLNDETKLLLLNNACRSGSEECALYLLCEGVKPDEETSWWPLITRGVWEGKGDVDILKKVVTYLNDETKLLLLNCACWSCSEEYAFYLLCGGVKPDKSTPLWSLIARGVWKGKGDVDILKKVVTYLNDETKFLLLNDACCSGSEECASYLLCEGVKPARKHHSGH
ncbi:uncharacterized protein LOC117327214 [Pecten maximus]|uniref:uncharacterized protein LOC117327214 n=1 Tax=Pecten maximus TaxID=6579 RepID=UPI0014588F72|nr:uncharacterized protein LOC117327214 [Pecten maximus]